MYTLLLFLGRKVEIIFKNLRSKYGREKRKIQDNKRSGSASNKTKSTVSDMYPFSSWLAPYIQSRNTISNYHMSEEEEEKEQEEDEESKEQYHKQTRENINNDELQEWSQTSQSATSTSTVTGRPKHTGRRKKERLTKFLV